MGIVFDYMLLVLGFGLFVFGLIIWIRQKASMTFDFNWSKVKEEDIKKFTTAYGITYSTMGLFITFLALSRIFLEGRYRDAVFVLYLVAYLFFLFIIKRIQVKFGTK